MSDFSQEELRAALRAIASTIGKCEKAQPKLQAKLPKTKPQLTLLENRIRALQIAQALIEREMEQALD